MMKLLDLFCGAGGCARGYQQAGFYVVGVDIESQPHYCGNEFHQADAFEYLAEHWQEYDAIHGSPVCKGYWVRMARYKPRTGLRWNDTLTNIRCAAGISRAELAATCGVGPGFIGEVETGRKCIPQHVLDQYGKIAESLRREP